MWRKIDWDRAWEIAIERDWTREELAEDFVEWVTDCDADDPEYLMDIDEDARWDLFFDSMAFERIVESFAEQIQEGDI